MISRIHLSALLAIAAALWGAFLILDGIAVSIAFFKPFSIVLGILVLVLIAFDRYAWRWPFLYPWFVPTQSLQGTWKGVLVSTWIDPAGENLKRPIVAYLVVRQTFSSVHMRLFTEESGSEMLAGNVMRDADGTVTIAAIYRNNPRLLLRDASPIHYGGLLLQVRDNLPQALDGQYWTDRDTKGELRFTERIEKLCYNFQEASKAEFIRAGV